MINMYNDQKSFKLIPFNADINRIDFAMSLCIFLFPLLFTVLFSTIVSWDFTIE